MKLFPGKLEAKVAERLKTMANSAWLDRLWQFDPTLWTQDPEVAARIKNRLGWLEVPEALQNEISALPGFVADLYAAGIRRAVLLGMGGSSLCPHVQRSTFGVASDGIDVRVLDSTSPDAVLEVAEWADQQPSVFIVASKSGSTIEVRSFFEFFWQRVKDPKRFLAITDPHTPLEIMARKTGFLRVFVNPADIGGRFSALSLFGLVPLALLGWPLDQYLAAVRREIDHSGRGREVWDCPGLKLGALLGEAALHGNNKMTLILSERLSTLGLWIEQLVAESTGKDGVGILPVDQETLDSTALGEDRVVVAVHLGEAAIVKQLAQLRTQGHPIVEMPIPDEQELGALFFRFELATATAGSILSINPFDEPNVTESKELTQALLSDLEKHGRFEKEVIVAEDDQLAWVADSKLDTGATTDVATLLKRHFSRAKPGDFIALLAYVHETPRVHRCLQKLREELSAKLGLPVTIGFGPRFLHSTGQLHKGGMNQGLYLQINDEGGEHVDIPGVSYDFGTLIQAQSRGDFQALDRRGRRVLRCHLKRPRDAALAALKDAVVTALS